MSLPCVHRAELLHCFRPLVIFSRGLTSTCFYVVVVRERAEALNFTMFESPRSSEVKSVLVARVLISTSFASQRAKLRLGDACPARGPTL